MRCKRCGLVVEINSKKINIKSKKNNTICINCLTNFEKEEIMQRLYKKKYVMS